MNMDLELPGGVITTHCVSTVIRPGSKVTHDPLQFVKIQSTELSKKAVEQIRLAEEVKITKDKIKEVEEEWQNNLLNWKSKRRQSRTTINCSLTDTEGDHDNEEDDHHHHLSHHHHHLSHHLSHHHLSHHHHHHHHHHDDINNRKIKTFSEILNDKAKSGYRIGYNLHKYIRNGSEDDDEEEEEDEDEGCKMMEDDVTSRLSSSSDDSSDKKIQSSSESSESTTPAPSSQPTNKSYSGCLKTVDGDNDDDDDDDGDDGDDEAAHDSVDDRSSSSLSPSSKLVNGQAINSNGLKNSPLDNELIDRQQQHQQLTDKQEHQQINLKNNHSHNLDYQQQLQQSGNNQQHGIAKLTLKPSLSLPPIQSKLIKPAICKINSYTDTINQSGNSNIGKKVILKFKIDKDISRQSSLPLLSSSSTSLSSSLTASCDREIINKRFSSSENEIKEINPETEPRLSFRDKLSNFENLSKEKDIGLTPTTTTNQHNHQPSNPTNQHHNLHHSHLQKVRKLTESTSSICDSETINLGSSSSEVEIISEIKVNQLNEPRLSFRDKLSNFENLAKGEDLIGSSSSSSSTNHHPLAANPNHLNPLPPPSHQPHHLSKDKKLTEATSSSSSLSSSSSSSSSSSTRISGHPILTSSLSSSSSLSNHLPYQPYHHLNHHDEQIKKDDDQSSSCSSKLGEKSCSEAQLLVKKSNEKPNQDQRSMLSISGKKRCSNCGDELGRGCAAMVIETLSLYYHINCFRCSVCHIQLGNGTCGTDVRVRSNRLHCQNCYSNDEVGLTRV